MGIEVRRGRDRAVTRSPGVESRHAFSFGAHYDPGNTSFGLLVACNEDRLAPGAGYPPHAHRDLEIVTWVLSGSLRHQDSTGTRSVLRPGQVQRLSAGRGVVHSETNDAWLLDPGLPRDEPVHLVQTWLLPGALGGAPGHACADVDLGAGGLVVLAAGDGRDAGLGLAQPGAALSAARLGPGDQVVLPDAPRLHVLVTRGEVVLEGTGVLVAGDEARGTAAGGQRLSAAAPAEVLVWEMRDPPG